MYSDLSGKSMKKRIMDIKNEDYKSAINQSVKLGIQDSWHGSYEVAPTDLSTWARGLRPDLSRW